MKFYQINFEDFKRVFTFASQYYLDPNKNTTGRTTSEPRGLGAVIDAFTLGKLTEIGVEKILNFYNPNKKYLLDFNIHKTSKIKNDPDINFIVDGNEKRAPNLFIEIKNTGAKDRWIGLTEEQFETIKKSANNKKIYFIYASIDSGYIENNPKTGDLAGMFLKKIENSEISKIFQEFSDLNALCRIEFILSSDDFDIFGHKFKKGKKMYETEIFNLRKNNSIFLKDSKNLVKNCQKISEKSLNNETLNITEKINKDKDIDKNIDKDVDEDINIDIDKEIDIDIDKDIDIDIDKKISQFTITGDFELYQKKSLCFIYCLSNVKITNDIFGEFNLEKNKVYEFFLKTIGRDPLLKRNNIFISKHRIYQLITEGKIAKAEILVQEIAKQI